MANSAGDARGTELEIRKKLIQSGGVDVVVSIGPNFFYTVTLPCTLWFFDKGKPKERKNTVLFINASAIYQQIDRAHRDFTPQQLEFISNIVRLYRRCMPPPFTRRNATWPIAMSMTSMPIRARAFIGRRSVADRDHLVVENVDCPPFRPLSYRC